jgi:hypothetical protein
VIDVARGLLDRDVPVEEIIDRLRAGGCSLSETVGVLARVTGISPGQARDAVVDSSAWSDLRGRPETFRETPEWIEARTRLGPETLERLHDACDLEPRLREAWVAIRRLTRADGSGAWREETLLNFVFDPSPDVRSHGFMVFARGRSHLPAFR